MARGPIKVWDCRFGDEPKLIATHENVPVELMAREVMMRLGIGRHLWVTEDVTGTKGELYISVLNHGDGTMKGIK